MRGSKFPSGVGSLISQMLRSLDLETRVKEQMCVLVWDEVVGEYNAAVAQPEFVRDGVLFVVTKSSSHANNLHFLKTTFIANLNQRVGGNVLKDIIFKAGRISRREKPAERVDEEALEGIQLSDRELETVETAARGAGEGAEMMSGLLATALRLEKWKTARGWTPCGNCGALQKTDEGICPMCRLDTR